MLVRFHLFTKFNVKGVHDSRVLEGIVHDVTVAIEVPSIVIRVLISVLSRPRVKSVGGFPLVGHVISVGVFQPRGSKVAFTEELGDLVLLQVVHAVFVPITVTVGGVCRIEHIGSVWSHGWNGIAVLESIRHAVAVRVPIRGSVEQAVVVHVHHEPTAFNPKEGPNPRNRVEQVFVALLAHPHVRGNGGVGNLDDVVDQVLVRVPSRRVGAKSLFLKVCKTIVIGVKNHVTGVASVGGEVIPVSHPVLAVEARFKSVNHGLVEQETIPVSVEGVEENNFTTWRLNAHRVQRLPSVVQTIVVRIGSLGVRSKFGFSLVGEAVSVGVAVWTLTWVRP